MRGSYESYAGVPKTRAVYQHVRDFARARNYHLMILFWRGPNYDFHYFSDAGLILKNSIQNNITFIDSCRDDEHYRSANKRHDREGERD